MNHESNDMTDLLPMIIISVIAGLLATMNIWANSFNHVRLHLNDFYMAFLMTSWMLLLTGIYNKNISYFIIGLLLVSIFIYLIRNQVFINETQFMKGMIPHHSMATLMAEQIKKKSKDPKIVKLADQIIDSQNKEINYMIGLGY